MAGPAAYLGFLETLRALQRFDHERCLPKAPVLVKPFSREFSERLPQAVPEELSRRSIVQFTVGPGIANRRLHVALSTNGKEFSTTDFVEIYRWIQRLLRMVVMFTHFQDVASGRTVSHLAIDSWLFGFGTIELQTS